MGCAVQRVEDLEAQLAHLKQTRVAVDAELHAAVTAAQREREHRIRLESQEAELRATLVQAATERDALAKLKEKGAEELKAARAMLRAAQSEAERNLRAYEEAAR
eukprot:1256678-Alexandrium_andersonii.AAC.1